jgi:hypothetical protein
MGGTPKRREDNDDLVQTTAYDIAAEDRRVEQSVLSLDETGSNHPQQPEESHPVGVAVGTLIGGAVSGAAAGSIAGPMGAVVGTVVGGLTGGMTGKMLSDDLSNFQADEAIAEFKAGDVDAGASRGGFGYADYDIAFRYGVLAKKQFNRKSWDDIETDLAVGWESFRGDNSRLPWSQAWNITKDGFERDYSCGCTSECSTSPR